MAPPQRLRFFLRTSALHRQTEVFVERSQTLCRARNQKALGDAHTFSTCILLIVGSIADMVLDDQNALSASCSRVYRDEPTSWLVPMPSWVIPSLASGYLHPANHGTG